MDFIVLALTLTAVGIFLSAPGLIFLLMMQDKISRGEEVPATLRII